MSKDKHLGQILIEKRLLTSEQLKAALDLQRNTVPYQPLGRYIVKLNYLKEEDLQQYLDTNEKRQKIEEIYYQHRFVEKDDLILAINMAKEEQLPVTAVLKNLGFIDDEIAAKALALQNDLPFMHINTVQPTHGLVTAVSPAFAKNHKIVPVAKTTDMVTIAMAQPLGAQAIQQLEKTLRLKVRPVIAVESQILSLQEKLYNRESPGAKFRNDIKLDDKFLDDAKDVPLDHELDADAKQVTEKDSTLVKLVNRIITDAVHRKASDIHIEPYPDKEDVVVRIRIDGHCEEYLRIPYKYKFALPSRVKIMADLDIAEKRKPQDGKIKFKQFGPLDVELRVATMPTTGGMEDVVIRILQAGEPTPFENLGLSERNLTCFAGTIVKPYGMVLVVGPTGSGKTTTLHSAISKINRPDIKIWTAEDPVEITQKGLRQVQVNAKIGFTFAQALRSFLRLDPDVIMVGEMRDQETALIAVEASLTGHLVFSTLHTNTAPDTITRLLEMGLDPFSFSDALQMILAQRLARRLCEHCSEQYAPDDREIAALLEEYGGDLLGDAGLARGNITLSRRVGCSQCGESGYQGRLGIHELLVCNEEIRDLIKKRADTALIRKQAKADGMLTLKQDGILKVMQGLTDIHEIRRVCIQ